MSLTVDQILKSINTKPISVDDENSYREIFTMLFDAVASTDVSDMDSYCIPYQGSQKVVQQFSKLNGLVVLKRSDALSERIMQIILSNWSSIASERGLSFLKFVLKMLYPNQQGVTRLWHSISKKDSYPNYLYENDGNDRFLTSRIRILFNDDIDIEELSELVPILSRLVPANIVTEVTLKTELEPIDLGVAVVAEKYHIANFSEY